MVAPAQARFPPVYNGWVTPFAELSFRVRGHTWVPRVFVSLFPVDGQITRIPIWLSFRCRASAFGVPNPSGYDRGAPLSFGGGQDRRPEYG